MSEELKSASRDQESKGPVYVLTPADFAQSFDDEDQISLVSYLNVLLRRRWLILGCTFFAALAAYAFSKLQTKEYQATATFLVAEKSGSVAGEQGDSLFVSLKNPVDYYKKIAVSSPILDPLLKTEFTNPRGGTGTMTLLDLWKVKGGSQEERLYYGRRALSDRIDLSNPREFPYILTLQVTAESPRLAADLANRLIAALSAYDVELKTSNAREKIRFIDSQVKDTESKLQSAESKLEQFLERNRVLTATPLRMEKDRLEREVQLQQELSVTLKKELELARITEKKEASAISVIDKATPPRAASRPRTLMNVALAGVVGFMMAIFLAFVLEYAARLSVDRNANPELFQTIEDMKDDARRLLFLGRKKSPAQAEPLSGDLMVSRTNTRKE